MDPRSHSSPQLGSNPDLFRMMGDGAPVLIWTSGPDKLCNWFNDRWLQFTGRRLEEELGNGWIEGVHPDDRDLCISTYIRSFDSREPFSMEYRLRRHDGEYRWVLDNGAPLFTANGGFSGYIGSGIDITDSKQVEQQLQLLVQASSTLFASPDQSHVLDTILTLAQRFVAAEGYAVWRRETARTWRMVASHGLPEGFNPIAEEPVNLELDEKPMIFEDLDSHEILNDRLGIYRSQGIRSLLVVPMCLHGAVSGTLTFYYRARHAFSQNELRVASALANLAAGALGTSDLYEQQKASRARAESEERRAAFLAEAGAEISAALDYHKTLSRLARLVVPLMADWCTIDVLDEAGQVQRLAVQHADPAKTQFAAELARLYPPRDDEPAREVLRTGRSQLIAEITDSYIAGRTGGDDHFAAIRDLGLTSFMAVPLIARGRTLGVIAFITAESGRRYTKDDLQFAEELAQRAALAIDNARLFQELHRERERTEEANRALLDTNAALRRANVDLEQFAYSASHDLQEPLRNVAIYSHLLDRRYRDRLDAQAQQFIGYISEGAKRLDILLRDLLTYARATTDSEEVIEPINTLHALQKALSNLRLSILETQAQITYDPLPFVRAREVHLEQIFQNLIGNALKYRRAETPAIHIAAETSEIQCHFRVTDNGIGIAPEFTEKIFGVFKRLHGATKYSGTGIGLAICQRIVERYGGRVWVESELGEGSTFHFTLPAADCDTIPL